MHRPRRIAPTISLERNVQRDDVIVPHTARNHRREFVMARAASSVKARSRGIRATPPRASSPRARRVRDRCRENLPETRARDARATTRVVGRRHGANASLRDGSEWRPGRRIRQARSRRRAVHDRVRWRRGGGISTIRTRFESRSRVVRTRRASDGDGADDVVVVLDETIAYPGGRWATVRPGEDDERDGRATFAFERVRGLADGTIEHEGRFEAGTAFGDGEDVDAVVDALRLLHARIHSAGHALDVAMIRIGLGPEVLMPTKGVRTHAGVVEYQGKLAR